jgi:cytochrome c biogenesis protein CcdA
VIEVSFAYVFTAGLVAAVNPCGFPMLPAYLSYFIGTDDDDVGTVPRVLRALGSAGAVSLGFVAVFAGLGIPINAGVTWIYDVMPWLTMVIGVALIALGIAMLRGWKLVVALPRLDKGGRSRRFGSMVLFGVSYAITSLGCTLPVFLLVVTGSSAGSNLVSHVLAFITYSLGMAAVLTALSLALALARESLVRGLRRAVQYVDRASGVLLVLVGLYLIWYGRFALDPVNGTGSAPLSRVEDWSSSASVWLSDRSTAFGLFVAVAVGAVAAVAVWRRRSSV